MNAKIVFLSVAICALILSPQKITQMSLPQQPSTEVDINKISECCIPDLSPPDTGQISCEISPSTVTLTVKDDAHTTSIEAEEIAKTSTQTEVFSEVPAEDAVSLQERHIATPQMGDTRVADGQKQAYFLGFGWIDSSDEPNQAICAEDMYENGNKVGIMD